MDALPWLNELRAELARRKLPPLYVERIVLELEDHFSDCMEDRMSTDAKDLHGVFQRLGSPDQVASSAAQEYRRARFSRRHPVLMFVLLPIVSLPVLWALSVFATVRMAVLFGLDSESQAIGSPVWQTAEACLPYVVIGLLLLPGVVAATFFSRLARKATVDWKWTLAACLLIAFLCGMAAVDIALPSMAQEGRFTFGLSLKRNPSVSQVLQFLLPLSIGGWAVWRQLKDHQTMCAG